MPTSLPMPTKSPGDVLTSTLWNSYLRDNLNKLLNTGHRVLTVAQFAALTGLEDGDEVYLEVDATNGVMWHLRYVAAETTYKWRFLGGPPLTAEIATDEGTASTSYVDLATAGPSISTPRGGDFDTGFYAEIYNTGVAANFMSPSIGGAAPAAGDDANFFCPSTSGNYEMQRSLRKTGLAASASVKTQYKASSSTAHFLKRRLELRPVRII